MLGIGSKFFSNACQLSIITRHLNENEMTEKMTYVGFKLVKSDIVRWEEDLKEKIQLHDTN